MRRLAVIAATTVVVAGVGPAMAGTGRERRPDSSCERNATLTGSTEAPPYVDLTVGAGSVTDRPVQSAFVCTDGTVARRNADATTTVWVDTTYGSAGHSCAQQPAPEAVTCKQSFLPLPGRSTERVDSPENSWYFQALGVRLSYEVDKTVKATAQTPATCVPESGACAAKAEYRVWARPDADNAGAGAQDAGVTAPVVEAPAG